MRVNPHTNVAHNIHVVKECVKRRIVRREVGVYVTVIEILRAHVINQIGRLQAAPIFNQIFVVGSHDFWLQIIKILHRFMLHGITKPSSQITLAVSPSNSPWHRNLSLWHCAIACFADSQEIVFLVLKPTVD